MRTISILGDSISTYQGCVPAGYDIFYQGEVLERSGVASPDLTWWATLARLMGSRVLANSSYSGSLVEGAGFPAGDSDARCEARTFPGGGQPDLVVVFMGATDSRYGGARAQAAARARQVPVRTDLSLIEPGVAGLAPVDAAERFGSAYGSMLGRVRLLCPEARVWCMTLLPGRVRGSAVPDFCHNLRGVPMRRYNDAIRRAAAAAGCDVLDVASFGLDYDSLEGTHPTALGMRQLAAMALAAMRGDVRPDPEAFGGDADPASSVWASRVLCDDRPCVGCRWALDTGNSWRCTCLRPEADRGGMTSLPATRRQS